MATFNITDKGRTDDPDPVTGLTSRDRYLTQYSWRKYIMADPVKHGVDLLILFFRRHPEYQLLFEAFAHDKLEDLPKNKRYVAHCNSVVYGLAGVVDHINDNEMVSYVYQRLGENHAPRGVPAKAYDDLGVTTIDYFSGFMTKEEVDAWRKSIKIAFPSMQKALIEKNKELQKGIKA